jgi:cytosine/adenosine deaminase-related metal-dependent hydrolase
MSSNSGDMFAQMRLGLQFERCMRNDAINAEDRMPERLDLTVRDALRWATLNGAHAMGMEDRIGSLAIGKQADLIVIGGGRLNMTPMADPVGCLVAQANPSNVEHVLVAGRFVKRDGELCGVDLDRTGELARSAWDRVAKKISDQGLELLPPAPEGFADAIRALATQHLEQAWALDVAS